MEFHDSINQYQMLEVIGIGGWSSVIKGYDTLHHRYVAIKIIPKKIVYEMKSEAIIHNEVAIMKRLDHPNIIKFFEVIEDTKNVYIIMELCDYDNLYHFVINSCIIPEFLIRKIMSQISSAIKYIHDQDIAHGDLKLENILYNPLDQKIKIIDFGYSQYAEKGQIYPTQYCSISYAPPEILKDNKSDPFKADIWSLGIIYYSLCFRKQPFYSEEEKDEMEKFVNCSYEIPNNATQFQKQIILSTLCNNPTQRMSATKLFYSFQDHNYPTSRALPKIKISKRKRTSFGYQDTCYSLGQSKLPILIGKISKC